MKRIIKSWRRVTAVLLGASLFLTGSCRAEGSPKSIDSQSATGVSSAEGASSSDEGISSENAALTRYVDSILDSMRNNRFASVANDLVSINSGANPVYANVNGAGTDGIDRQPKLRYSEEEILSNVKKYLENVFGEHAWENAAYTIENAPGTEHDQFLVFFTFNGLDVAPTGEGGVQIIVKRDSDTFKIWQSFSWYTQEDQDYRGRTDLVKGMLKDNSDRLPPQIRHLITQFIESLEKENIEWIASKIKEKLSVWIPDQNKIYPTSSAVLSEQIDQYKAYAAQSQLKSPHICTYVIDCFNDANYRNQVWFDVGTNEQLSEADAKKTNDDFIIQECLKYGIHYDAAQNGANLTEDEIRIMNDHQISPGYYPAQPVGSFINRYILYKVNLIFDDMPNDAQEYFSFYISNQDGIFDIISSLYYEPVYECGVSVQRWGD